MGKNFDWEGSRNLAITEHSVLRRGRLPPISYMRTCWSSWEIWKLGSKSFARKHRWKDAQAHLKLLWSFVCSQITPRKTKQRWGPSSSYTCSCFLYKSECNSDSEPELKVILWISTWLRCITGEIYLITDSGKLTNI